MLLGSQALVNDPYYNDVVLLLRGYDATSGQTFKDYSKYNRTVTANGNVAHSTTQKKHGNSSIYFDGMGDYLTVPASSDFGFGIGDFTFELWGNQTSGAEAPQLLVNNVSWGPNSWGLTTTHPSYPTKLGFYVYNILPSSAFLISSSTFSNNVWNHIFLKRQGNSFYLYLNGVLESTNTSNASIDSNSPNAIRLGTSTANDNPYNGYIEDLRITKGIARPIAVPAQPFPNW